MKRAAKSKVGPFEDAVASLDCASVDVRGAVHALSRLSLRGTTPNWRAWFACALADLRRMHDEIEAALVLLDKHPHAGAGFARRYSPAESLEKIRRGRAAALWSSTAVIDDEISRLEATRSALRARIDDVRRVRPGSRPTGSGRRRA